MSAVGTSRWERVAAAFDTLVELSPPEREAGLDALRRREPDIADEVERMLRADSSTRGPLDARLEDLVTLDLPDSVDRAGQMIDEYRLVERIGRGGMGEVYLAERDAGGFRQRVAVKLLRRGIDTDDVLRRFAQERRILALLEHPGIARLIDGGATPAGAPYLVMEYVEGELLSAYLAKHAPGVDARIRLVIAICDAVDYAHRRLVVHRDLKPSNVIVTADGQPKLLDFGIAKLLDERGAGGDETGTDMRVLSPAYAAPEQILGEPIGTTTDVYSLGVILYETLCGELPHVRGGRSLDALARAVGDETIERPSSVLRRHRGIDSTRRARALEGDLDTIVMHALAREPDRRYPSAAAFADDLRRYLGGMPIRARADTWTYRVGKFVHRHRGGVAASVLMLLAIFGALGLALWQADRAQAEAANAAREAAAAAAQAERAERVKDFVLTLFREQDPLTRDKAKAATAGELIARGIAAAKADFAQDPALESEIVGDLAELQFSLGDIKEARATLESLVELRRRVHGEDSVPYGVALASLGGAQMALGEREVAGDSIKRGVEILRAKAGPEALETADAEMRLQRYTLEQGEPAAALPIAEHVLAVYQRERGPDHPETLRRHYNLGVVLEQLDRLDDAEREFRTVIAGYEKSGSPDHAQLVFPNTLLGDVLRRKRDYPAAAERYEAALAAATAALGPTHRHVGQIAMRRGDLLRRMRRYDEAIASLTHAEAAFAPLDAPELGQVWIYRGQLHRQREQFPDAIAYYEKAVAQYRKTLGPDTLFTRGGELSLAATRAESGDVERGVREAKAAVDVLRARAKPGTFETAFAAENYGDVLSIAGRHEAALAEFRVAREQLVAIYDEDHSGVATVDHAIAKSLLALGTDLQAARKHIDQALAVVRKADATDPAIGELLLTSAALAKREGDAPRAKREYAEARPILEATYGAGHAMTREAAAGAR